MFAYSTKSTRRLFLVLLGFPATLGVVRAEPTTTYDTPPKAIADLIDAPQTPQVILSPAKDRMLIGQVQALPPLSELAQPELRLAGMRINPRTNGPSRGTYYVGLKLMEMSDLKEREVQGLPANPRIGAVRWSPDGRRFAFTITTESAVNLWYGDVSTATVRQVTPRALNAASGAAYGWMPDGNSFYARLVPENRKPAPEKPLVPAAFSKSKSFGCC
jgi:dipeptidyl aminopeptidase/acylaminoacyl peptidase